MQGKETKIDSKIYLFLNMNGGDLTLKNPPNAILFCMHVEEIKLYPLVWTLSRVENPPKFDFFIILYALMLF